jgi:hypothetical protein
MPQKNTLGHKNTFTTLTIISTVRYEHNVFLIIEINIAAFMCPEIHSHLNRCLSANFCLYKTPKILLLVCAHPLTHTQSAHICVCVIYTVCVCIMYVCVCVCVCVCVYIYIYIYTGSAQIIGRFR